jgi:hypothetical protein
MVTTEKLWEECSQEEQNEVNQIELKYIQLRKDYSEQKINQRQYKYRKTRLLNKLSKIEEKYRDDTYELKLFDLADENV